jgi:hypothetical protein
MEEIPPSTPPPPNIASFAAFTCIKQPSASLPYFRQKLYFASKMHKMNLAERRTKPSLILVQHNCPSA